MFNSQSSHQHSVQPIQHRQRQDSITTGIINAANADKAPPHGHIMNTVLPPGSDQNLNSLPSDLSLAVGMDLDINGQLSGLETNPLAAMQPQSATMSVPSQQQSTEQQQIFPQLPQAQQQSTHIPHKPNNDLRAHSSTLKTSGAVAQAATNVGAGVGAGPLPAGFGITPGQNGGSTLTEFTKRRNWSQRVIEEIKDFLHILDANGRIMFVSSSTRSLTGYPAEELHGKMMRDFLHPDDYALWMREFHESIASGNQLRFFYRFRKADNSYIIFECFGHPHLSSQAVQYGPNNPAGICRGFFMMARPYPTKNATLLDSFLEHKIENERLTKRIADLRKEEQTEIEQQNQQWEKSKQQSRPTISEGISDETPQTTTSGHSTDYNLMPPPSKPAISNLQLTQQNLDEANASSKPDSINDKMARYEGATHIETIEMLTGLRYRDGERSHGISTGDLSPSLIKGDAGIAMPVDRDGRGGDKKKKLKMADEYVCTDCGTLDSPEWRKGPSGPKTLCNACGLRWAKKEKKKQAPPQSLAQGQMGQVSTTQPSLNNENSQGST